MARRKQRSSARSSPPAIVKENKCIHPVWEKGSIEELKALVCLAARVHFIECSEQKIYLRCSTRTETEASQVSAPTENTHEKFLQLVRVFLNHNVCFGQMPNGKPCFFIVTTLPSSFHERIEASLLLSAWLQDRVAEDEISRLLSD